MAAQKQDDQHERTFSSYVRIQVVVLKTCLGRWTIGRSGERGSGISVLPARYDDDDIYIYIYIHIYIYIYISLYYIISFHTISILYLNLLPGHWPNEKIVRQWFRWLVFDPRSTHTKDSKMVLDAALLNTQHYKVRIKGKVEQSRERSSTLPYTLL